LKRYYLHKHLVENFPEVVGVDVSRENVKKMLELDYKNVFVMNAECIDRSKMGKFDTIVAGDLVEHLSNPGLFLQSAAECLNPGGRIVIATPNPFSPMFFLMYLKNLIRAFDPEHSLWMCPQTLSQLASRYDFSLTKCVFVDFLIPKVVSSIWYKVYGLLWKVVRPIMPKRIRRWFIVVLERL